MTASTPLYLSHLTTPLGTMLAAVNDQGLAMLEFENRKALTQQFRRVEKHLNAHIIEQHHPLHDEVQRQLNDYFAGTRTHFDLILQYAGTDFQQAAWKALCEIPYGETRSYQQQANALGREKSARPVATANASNPIAIVVPCHRVIAKQGGLAGYAGGIERKQQLINLEQQSRHGH